MTWPSATALPVGQRVLPHQGVPEDRLLSTRLYLIELGGQPCREEFEPPRQIHVLLAHTLGAPGKTRPGSGRSTR